MTRRTAVLAVCLVLTLILTAPSLFHSDRPLLREDVNQASELVQSHRFLLPPSGKFTEKQLLALLAVVNALQEFAQKPAAAGDTLESAKARLLEEHNLSPEEYDFIADKVAMAGVVLEEQAVQMMSGATDFEMEGLMSSMGLSDADKAAMRKARAEKRKWWKGTPEAPSNNLELAAKYEKEIHP